MLSPPLNRSLVDRFRHAVAGRIINSGTIRKVCAVWRTAPPGAKPSQIRGRSLRPDS
jgi:hypothetical protein